MRSSNFSFWSRSIPVMTRRGYGWDVLSLSIKRPLKLQSSSGRRFVLIRTPLWLPVSSRGFSPHTPMPNSVIPKRHSSWQRAPQRIPGFGSLPFLTSWPQHRRPTETMRAQWKTLDKAILLSQAPKNLIIRNQLQLRRKLYKSNHPYRGGR